MSREWAGVHALGDVCGNQTGPLGRPAFPPEFIIPATATFPPPPPPPGFFLHTKASERKRELFSLQPAHIHTHSSQEGFIVGGRFYFIFLKTPGTWDILSVFSEVGKWHTEREGELHRERHTTGGGGLRDMLLIIIPPLLKVTRELRLMQFFPPLIMLRCRVFNDNSWRLGIVQLGVASLSWFRRRGIILLRLLNCLIFTVAIICSLQVLATYFSCCWTCMGNSLE